MFHTFFFVPGSDASEVNIKSAQKVNQIAASLQHDNTRRGSSAAESQGTLNYLLFEPGIFWPANAWVPLEQKFRESSHAGPYYIPRVWRSVY